MNASGFESETAGEGGYSRLCASRSLRYAVSRFCTSAPGGRIYH